MKGSFGSIHESPPVFVAVLLKWVLVCNPQQHFCQELSLTFEPLKCGTVFSCFPVYDQSSIHLQGCW